MKILVLEDEQSVSSAIRFSLQKKGHSVVESHNPIDALNRIEHENFELRNSLFNYLHNCHTII